MNFTPTTGCDCAVCSADWSDDPPTDWNSDTEVGYASAMIDNLIRVAEKAPKNEDDAYAVVKAKEWLAKFSRHMATPLEGMMTR